MLQAPGGLASTEPMTRQMRHVVAMTVRRSETSRGSYSSLAKITRIPSSSCLDSSLNLTVPAVGRVGRQCLRSRPARRRSRPARRRPRRMSVRSSQHVGRPYTSSSSRHATSAPGARTAISTRAINDRPGRGRHPHKPLVGCRLVVTGGRCARRPGSPAGAGRGRAPAVPFVGPRRGPRRWTAGVRRLPGPVRCSGRACAR
jgi:hypothetical protein